MGGDPGEGALYAIAAAAIAVGVQYAYNQYQQYRAAKAYRAAHAPTADQAGKVSPANHGHVREEGFLVAKNLRPGSRSILTREQADSLGQAFDQMNNEAALPERLEIFREM